MSNRNYQITWLIRRVFRAMADRSNSLLVDRGISAADRAVLEFLYPDQTLSVPALAARYDVSRQHVQVTVNRLLDRSLVTAKPNPRHRRSPLIALTRSGKRLFGKVLEEDQAEIDALFAGLSARQLALTHQTLESMLERLKKGETR